MLYGIRTETEKKSSYSSEILRQLQSLIKSGRERMSIKETDELMLFLKIESAKRENVNNESIYKPNKPPKNISKPKCGV